MELTTIAICIPNLGAISAACTRAILVAQAASQTQNRPYTFLHVDIESIIIGKARSLLAQTAMLAEADVVLFVDQDVVVPPHTVVALMDRNLPIVGGFYIGRRMPYMPQIYTTEGTEGVKVPFSTSETTPRHTYWPIVDYPDTPDLLEVDAIGAGCLMIRREVFERMAEQQEEEDARLVALMQELEKRLPKATWAKPGAYELLQEHVRVMDPWFEFLTDEGEDMYFCRKARHLGYKIYVDLSVKCQHLGTVPVEEQHFLFIKPHLHKDGEVPVTTTGPDLERRQQ